MKQNKKLGVLTYLLFDFLAAVFSWSVLFFFRKIYIEHAQWHTLLDLVTDRYFLGILTVPAGWIFLYFLQGTYTDIYRKSRLNEVFRTLIATFLGVIVLFLFLILDDIVNTYKDYYQSISVLAGTHFLITILFRITILTIAKKRLLQGKVKYNTLIIGGNANAIDLYHEIEEDKAAIGYHFVGFIDTNGSSGNGLSAFLPCLGKTNDIRRLIEEWQIDEVIIAVETSEHEQLRKIMSILADCKVVINIIPDIYDIISGSVKMNRVLGAVLIEIYPELMPRWQKFIKRLLDIIVSVIVSILLSPLYLFITLRVKLSSPGPVLFRQERIGKNGRPFTLYKFRSMYVDAEKDGPALSSKNDIRVTPWGRVMRKWRLDELPQFYNVLKGDMSLVGPLNMPDLGFDPGFFHQLNQLPRFIYRIGHGFFNE